MNFREPHPKQEVKLKVAMMNNVLLFVCANWELVWYCGVADVEFVFQTLRIVRKHVFID